jgi:hypothetical protein
VKSFIVDDYRFKGKRDKTLTVLFKGDYVSGFPKASDDIEYVEWIPLLPYGVKLMSDHHQPLFEALL